MSSITLRNGRTVGDYCRPYIVAELNTSHFGDLDTAKDMIRNARESGCDCVKFQSWSADTLYSEQHYKENPIVRRMVGKFSLEPDQLRDLSLYAKSQRIDFASTPYSINEAEWLVSRCEVPFIKVASMELNNLPYLEQLGRLGAPVVLSTGMGSLSEIQDAVAAIEGTGNRAIAILHCTSIYPATAPVVRLRNIEGLRSAFPRYPIGYSDHSLGIEIATASVALGACLIEKHFTLNKSKIGMDNQMATEPEEMAALVASCHVVHDALGDIARIVSEEELQQRSKMRRSVVAARDLECGETIEAGVLEAKRPGTGIPPNALGDLVGRKLTRKVQSGELLINSDFEQ